MKEIKFTTTRKGQRRAYYCSHWMTWMPIGVAEAEVLIATGAAVVVEVAA